MTQDYTAITLTLASPLLAAEGRYSLSAVDRLQSAIYEEALQLGAPSPALPADTVDGVTVTVHVPTTEIDDTDYYADELEDLFTGYGHPVIQIDFEVYEAPANLAHAS